MRRATRSLLAGAVALAAASVAAQTWRFDPTVSLQETVTNNVNLDPAASRRSDLVTQITPALRFTEKGPRTTVEGTVAIPVVLYARTGADNDTILPSVNIVGDLAVVQNFFHVEAAATVTQQFFNPFGAQPSDFANATQNRYSTTTYRVSPYIKGSTPNNTRYELRNNNVWTNLSGAPIATDSSRYTQWIGSAANTQGRFGWQADFDVTDIRFNDQNSISTRLARFVPIFTPDPQLRLRASAGYEDNHFALTDTSGPIYGGGFEWRPSNRTSVVGNYEHRFFGGSFLVSFDHRTPLTAWSIRASRNITSYPQQVATLPPGVNVASYVNALFMSQYPDPAERQRAVDEFISNRGLPTELSSPVSLYAQQLILQESQTATFGLIGVRNTIFFTVFNVKSEQIAGSGNTLPFALTLATNNTQTGANIVWTHNLAPAVVLSGVVDGFRTVAQEPLNAKTNQGSATIRISWSITPKTSVFAGGRYQVLESNVASDYNEVAAFVGLNHSFR